MLGTKIGEGTFGKVYVNNNKVYKSVKKLVENNIELEIATIKEIAALKYLKHENIISILDIEENKNDENELNIILEYGGIELFKWIQNNTFVERLKYLNWIVFQILEVLVYLENQNIIYGDLKPSNILIDQNTKKIKIIDWGTISFKNSVNTWCSCTHVFASPEIFVNDCINYTNKVDIYSLGMIIRMIIYKKYEEENYYKNFITDNKNKFFPLIDTEISFPNDFDISCLQTYQSMLNFNYKERPSAKQLISLKIFENYLNKKPIITPYKTPLKINPYFKKFKNINDNMRKILLNWIYKLCCFLNKEYQFNLAVWIHDKYMQETNDQIEKIDYQKVGIACFAIADSIMNDISINLEELAEKSDNSFDVLSLNKTIWEILKTIKYDCYRVLFDSKVSEYEKKYGGTISWDIIKKINLDYSNIKLSEKNKVKYYFALKYNY